ncbi:MAG TPA: ABC transporter substrate-binding protein [Alphaproteobacteria bacterium]|nr:ABC transporter substrate-binding protein [Alphaproteobacteria bacterium]
MRFLKYPNSRADMWSRRAFLSRTIVALAASFGPPRLARANDVPEQAANFIKSLADEVIAILKNKSLGKDDRVRELARIFLEGFDVRAIGLFVLGTYARNLHEDERNKYIDTFKDYVVETYAARFNTYAGEDFIVTASTPDGEKGAWVFTNIGLPGDEPTEVQWRVRGTPDGFKIVDVVVEGVSLVVTQRSEFAAVLQRNNGSVPALTALLHQKIDQLKSKS